MSSKRKSSSSRNARNKTKDYLYEEDEEAFSNNFDILEKLKSPKFSKFFLQEMKGEDVNLEHFQRQGFNSPIFVPDKSGLHIKVPDSSFDVSDVRNLIGGKRVLEVMNCATQTNSQMLLRDWEEFFNHPDRDDTKLNVISLEFSQTKLESYVSAPRVVRQIDWVDNVWPRHLKNDQEDGTNDMRSMMYPKVQKYCLMSVAGCYTDFHIDFGGTSVWYHIIRGQKIFWLIPPTDENLKLYEEWTMSGKQGDVFFGDTVAKCGKIALKPGNTLLIPSGWIHAVYTPEDSLVFGGNFLHSFAIEKQLRVAQIEELTKVPTKFRFPFFTELQWYALDKYVWALLGKTHIKAEEEIMIELLGEKWERQEHSMALTHQHITPQELYGLKAIVMFIHALPVTRKSVPALIKNAVELIKDVRTIVESHKDDNPEKCVTGKALLFWSGKHEKKWNKHKTAVKRDSAGNCVTEKKPAARTPCTQCQGCKTRACGSCVSCNSLPRQRCVARSCEQPVLDTSCVCCICGLDGWYASPHMSLIDRPPETNSLMECSRCLRVVHPSCETDYGVEAVWRTDLPNLWYCPRCMKHDPPSEEELQAAKTVKEEETEVKQEDQFIVRGTSDQSKLELRLQMSEKIMAATSKTLKKPRYVFRPPPLVAKVEEIYERLKKQTEDNPVHLNLEFQLMLPVFKFLTTSQLALAARVCKSWHKVSLDPSLWTIVDLTRQKISAHLLSTTVQKQPPGLVLDWTNMGKQQLNWLLPRIPQTKKLSLVGLDFTMTVSTLNTCNCPLLQELNLSYVSNLTDSALHKLLSAPRDSRPGLLDKKSRLKMLKKLSVRNTEITDVSMRYVTQYLPQLTQLSVAGCWKLTDAGLAQLGSAEQGAVETLSFLDISYCRAVTDNGLGHLAKMSNLTRLDASHTQVSTDALNKFASKSQHKLKVYGKVIEKKHSSRSSLKKKSK